MFHRRSRAPNSAFSAPIRMSASSAVSRPAAKAPPLTAAMTGLNTSTRRVYPHGPGSSYRLTRNASKSPQLVQRGGVGQVPSRTERRLAGARDDEDECRRRRRGSAARRGAARPPSPVDRVVLLRAVVGERDDVPVLRVGEVLVVHPASLGAHEVHGEAGQVTTPGSTSSDGSAASAAASAPPSAAISRPRTSSRSRSRRNSQSRLDPLDEAQPSLQRRPQRGRRIGGLADPVEDQPHHEGALLVADRADLGIGAEPAGEQRAVARRVLLDVDAGRRRAPGAAARPGAASGRGPVARPARAPPPATMAT